MRDRKSTYIEHRRCKTLGHSCCVFVYSCLLKENKKPSKSLESFRPQTLSDLYPITQKRIIQLWFLRTFFLLNKNSATLGSLKSIQNKRSGDRLTAMSSVHDLWQRNGWNAFESRSGNFSSTQASSSAPTFPSTAFGAPFLLLFSWRLLPAMVRGALTCISPNESDKSNYLRYFNNLTNFEWSRWESLWWHQSWQMGCLVVCMERQQ